MGIRLISQAIEWYTPEEFKDENPLPRFKLKPLEADVYTEVTMDYKIDDDGNVLPSARAINKAIKEGLLSWENIGDDEKFTKANVKKLPPQIYVDVGARIIEISALSEEELKNS